MSEKPTMEKVPGAVSAQVRRADDLVLRTVRDHPGMTTRELGPVFLANWRAANHSNVDEEMLLMRLAEGLQRLRQKGRLTRSHVWTGTVTRLEWTANGRED